MAKCGPCGREVGGAFYCEFCGDPVDETWDALKLACREKQKEHDGKGNKEMERARILRDVPEQGPAVEP